MTKFLAYTSGEPAGIGPDLAIHLAQQGKTQAIVVIGDPDVFQDRAKHLQLPIKIISIKNNQHLDLDKHYTGKGQLLCLKVSVKEKVIPGELNSKNSNYVLQCIKIATELCLTGYFSGLVTGPIHKGIINQAQKIFGKQTVIEHTFTGRTFTGHTFTGHTEYLAELSNTKNVIMMLATEGLRVSLVTTHLPLKDVSQAITSALLKKIITLLNSELKIKFGIKEPKIAICGLNPHAGEDGHLGHEEIEVITPVIESLKKQGLLLSGPIPADTIFTNQYMKNSDSILAMYHDQGLPVLKYKGFGHAVNITLGLPFIRTSVDHGTALDLAGSNKINTGSLFYAIETALVMQKAMLESKG